VIRLWCARRIQPASRWESGSAAVAHESTFVPDLFSTGELHTMNRRREDFKNIDASFWPEVDVNALTDTQKTAFLQSRKSIQLFLSGTAIREIEQQTGLDRRQLYRLAIGKQDSIEGEERNRLTRKND
jgi:hypothetical protein